MSKYLETKKGSLEGAVLEAVSRAQQAAIAISKKEKGEKPKKEEMDPTDHVKEKDGKFCVYNADGTIAKEFDNKEDADKYAIANHDKLMATKDEELSAKQKKLDKNNNGKIDGDDLAALRKSAKKEEVELEEKVEYVEYKFKNKNDAMKAKAMLDGTNLMSFEINDDDISNGEIAVDAGNKDMTKFHKEIMKKFRPKVLTQEKKEEVKEEKDMSGMCCKNCGDMFGKPTAESSCTYDAYDPMGENWIPKEQYESKKKVNEMVEAAANAISDMWREAAKVEPKKEEEEPEADGKTMTGKPMSKVKVAPAEGSKEG